jgi:hypothetical protein
MEALDELTLRRRRERMLNPIMGELARLEELMFVYSPPSTPGSVTSMNTIVEEPKAEEPEEKVEEEEAQEEKVEEEEIIPQPPVDPRPVFTSPLRLRSKSRMEEAFRQAREGQ